MLKTGRSVGRGRRNGAPVENQFAEGQIRSGRETRGPGQFQRALVGIRITDFAGIIGGQQNRGDNFTRGIYEHLHFAGPNDIGVRHQR